MADILFQPLGNPVSGGPGLDRIGDIDPRLTRTHYFDGRLLTAEDLTRDQIYLDQRLREVGRVLGSGVVRGLAVALDPASGELTLQPGTALTPAGRVLELGRELEVDLGDSALISQLNEGRYRRFNRGLYAVVLRHIEVGTDRAEVFPTDLGAKRGSQVALMTEAVQLGLVPLPTPLPQQNPLQIRARLIREYLGDGQVRGLIPEDAVALGVVAIQDDRPQWLDAQLLRHPARAEPGPGDLQADLARHYESLLADVRSARSSGGLGDDFQAADHFSLLPPTGTVPAGSIDPVRGRQGYFPDNFQVSIAPIRLSDLALIQAESLALPPIDLSTAEPVHVMVLAPLSNLDYGHHARALERRGGADERLLPHVDPLRLRLHPRRPVHVLDTDASAWEAIREHVVGGQLVYVRRPTRAAETGISAIVLALGASLPAPAQTPEDTPEAGEESPADRGGLIEDEDTVFVRRLGFAALTAHRASTSRESETARRTLIETHGRDAALMRSCVAILLFVERRFDAVIWQTLAALADAGALERFRHELLTDASDADTVERVVELGTRLGVAREVLEQWRTLRG